MGSALIKLVKQQLQHIDVSINDKFGSFEELIFPKTLKSLPPTLPMKIYIGCKDDPPSTMSTKVGFIKLLTHIFNANIFNIVFIAHQPGFSEIFYSDCLTFSVV